MISKRLERFLVMTAKVPEAEALYRMQKHREWEQLPKSRGRNAEPLKTSQILVPIVGLASRKMGYAGQVAGMLTRLKPVGGAGASFAAGETFGDSLIALLDEPSRIETLDEIRIYADSSLAEIHYTVREKPIISCYVHKTKLTSTGKGAERTFDISKHRPPLATPLVLTRAFFQSLHREVERERGKHQEMHRVLESAKRQQR